MLGHFFRCVLTVAGNLWHLRALESGLGNPHRWALAATVAMSKWVFPELP